MSNQLTSQEWQELADLCQPTAENLRRIAKAYAQRIGNDFLAKDAFTVADKLQDAANAFGRAAVDRKRREDAEAKLRKDIADLAGYNPADSGVAGTVEAIIRRVRGES